MDEKILFYLSIYLFVHSFLFSFIDLLLFIHFFTNLSILPALCFFHTTLRVFHSSLPLYLSLFIHFDTLRLSSFFPLFIHSFIHSFTYAFFSHIFFLFSSTFPFAIYLSIFVHSIYYFILPFSHPFHSDHLFSFFIFFIRPLVPPQLVSFVFSLHPSFGSPIYLFIHFLQPFIHLFGLCFVHPFCSFIILGCLYTWNTWIFFFFFMLMFNCLGLVPLDKRLNSTFSSRTVFHSPFNFWFFGFPVCRDTLSILLDIKHDKDINSIMWIVHFRKGTQQKISGVSWGQVTKCNFSSAKGQGVLKSWTPTLGRGVGGIMGQNGKKQIKSVHTYIR